MFTILRSKSFSSFMCILLLTTFSFSLVSCGESDVSGAWSGTISTTIDNYSANMLMTINPINQSEGNINGSITFSSNGTIPAYNESFEACSFTGTVSSSGMLNFTCGPYTFSGTHAGSTINGPWNEQQNGVSGSFSVSYKYFG